jgi:hypothetical protein
VQRRLTLWLLVMTQIVPIKYRDAAELQATLQQHLGHCATISVDQRTNTLIITGILSCLRLRESVILTPHTG